MLHLENFFEKSFALLLTTPRMHQNLENYLQNEYYLCYNKRVANRQLSFADEKFEKTDAGLGGFV